MSCKSAGFKEAVQQIEEFIVNPEKFEPLFSSEQDNRPDPDVEFNKLREAADESAQEEVSFNNTTPKSPVTGDAAPTTPATGKKSAAKKKVRASLPIKLNVDKVVFLFVLFCSSFKYFRTDSGKISFQILCCR